MRKTSYKAKQALSEVDAQHAARFTAIAMTKNFIGSPHIDTQNIGYAVDRF